MSSASALPAPRSAFADFFDKAGMLVVLAILFLGCSLFVENFLSWRNLQGLALAVSMTGMVA
jgi:L-arabinose transport system permease protein